MVCSNYDPDPRKNVFKIGIVYRPSSIVQNLSSAFLIAHAHRAVSKEIIK